MLSTTTTQLDELAPPVAEAPNLLQEAGSQDCFIPKVCIHTWTGPTGHTQGISVIRSFTETGLHISGSMDTKIKVGLRHQLELLSTHSLNL